MSTDIRKQIRDQNDAFRRRDPTIPGRIVLTPGISDLLGGGSPDGLLAKVAAFDDFSEDNDPHREHDFAAMDFQNERLFWKIDYYDTEYMYGSDDPSDTTETRRVLTIMLVSEY